MKKKIKQNPKVMRAQLKKEVRVRQKKSASGIKRVSASVAAGIMALQLYLHVQRPPQTEDSGALSSSIDRLFNVPMQLSAVDKDVKVEDFATRVVFSESGIAVSGEGCRVLENRLMIFSDGTYELSGAAPAGVTVESACTRVRLVLNGLQLFGDGMGPTFNLNKAKKTVLTLVAGTENILTDPDTLTAVLRADTLVIAGTGSLAVLARSGDAIRCENRLFVCGGTLSAQASDAALRAADDVALSGGVVMACGGGAAVLSGGTFSYAGAALAAMGEIDVETESQTQPRLYAMLDKPTSPLTPVYMADTDGEAILAVAPYIPYRAVVFSSPELQKHRTYSLYLGGSAVGRGFYGIYDSAYNGFLTVRSVCK